MLLQALALVACLTGAPTAKPKAVEGAASKRAAAKHVQPPHPDDGTTAEERRTAEAFTAWRLDPVKFVREVFGADPDEWQRDALYAVAKDKRIAMSACKGPGKSCLLAWVIWWFVTTHYDAQVMALSITADNLKDNLWKELALWQSKSELLQRAFDFKAKRITNKARPKTWWVSARAFAKDADPSQQANSLAGFHNEDLMVVLDEVGDYPKGVLAAANAIFATTIKVNGETRPVNAKLVVAGNPTTVDGPLYDIVTADAARWTVITITGDPDNPKRSPRISLEYAREEIARHGRDNPWVMVNILGLFPPVGSDKLIGVNDVILAMQRDLPARTVLTDAIIWGLDPARSDRSGADEAVLARRQGLLERKMVFWRGKDGTQLGDAVARLLLEAEKAGELPDAVFVDVGGVGTSCYDRLVYLGWDHVVHPVDFGGVAMDERYADKRTEMWVEMAEWISKRPSCLPSDPVLQSELTAPRCWWRTIGHRTRFKLESKDEMKARGVPSPNRADALCLTFAAPVAPKRRGHRDTDLEQGGGQSVHEYEPFSRRAA